MGDTMSLASPIFSRIILHFVRPRSVVSIHQARRRTRPAPALIKTPYIPNRIVRQDFFGRARGAWFHGLRGVCVILGAIKEKQPTVEVFAGLIRVLRAETARGLWRLGDA